MRTECPCNVLAMAVSHYCQLDLSIQTFTPYHGNIALRWMATNIADNQMDHPNPPQHLDRHSIITSWEVLSIWTHRHSACNAKLHMFMWEFSFPLSTLIATLRIDGDITRMSNGKICMTINSFTLGIIEIAVHMLQSGCLSLNICLCDDGHHRKLWASSLVMSSQDMLYQE